MIKKIITYVIYADQYQEDGSAIRLRTEINSSQIKNSADIEVFEDLLSSQLNKKHKIIQWFPMKKSYLWFPRISQYFFNKKSNKK